MLYLDLSHQELQFDTHEAIFLVAFRYGEAPIEASGQVSAEPFVESLNESLTEPKKRFKEK